MPVKREKFAASEVYNDKTDFGQMKMSVNVNVNANRGSKLG